jgi:antitoxin (DNA-binding transcriptional repressor) of toxin-antitoxin stability system
MRIKASISIKELHEKTGELVRQAGHSRTPVPVTDRGKVVAVLAAPESVVRKGSKPVLLPEYLEVIAQISAPNDILEALDEVRGERL